MRCVRAVKSLRELEGTAIEAIALYTNVDRNAPFVRHADQAVRLPAHPNGSVAAYLDRDSLLSVLRRVGADAVWPGWGFVAEDAEFVSVLAKAGIRFLGPSADAMQAVGDKITSKELAERVGVPVTPWSNGALEDENDAIRAATEIGFPVVIKASAGGGGRGIRMVDGPGEIAEAFRSARAEAEGAFGDGRLFVEKRVDGGRHIEVQIAADENGVVHSLGCRDCSVQRRHQKVLEEAPAPHLRPELRTAIEEAAVLIAKSVSYVGVGTVEFLLEGDSFYFLEVNPRLQVEHGITEEVTGLDLVQLQIRIARGESLKDLEVRERGVAIEARVCAEDPDAGFVPSPGRIVRFETPQGARVRVDSGVDAGTAVPPDFDSLVAKVIATGETREEARARLAVALRDFELVVAEGASNRGYLLELLETKAYRAGGVDTRWLDRLNLERDQQGAADHPMARDGLVAAAILAYQQTRAAARVNFYADSSSISNDRIPPSQGQQMDLSYQGESYRLTVYAIGSWRYRVHLDGCAVGAAMREEGRHAARLTIDDRARRVLYDASDLGLRIEVDGHPMRFGWQTAGQVISSTPAMVVAVQVQPGDRVEAGQPLGLVEAMKMEIGFQAPVSGVVTEVRVRRGQQVAAGEVLLVIDAAADDTAGREPAPRLALPEQRDPLALLFRADAGDPLGEPDFASADAAPQRDRSRALQTVRNEIRRALLGYDINPDRGNKLVEFLEADLPDDLSREFLQELAELRHELATFAQVERLFIRAPRASVSGELGPSNNARFRMFVRRLHAGGAGIADEFLDLVRSALFHYGIVDLEPSDAMERAVLRVLASQLTIDLRLKLVLGLIRRVTALMSMGVELGRDAALSEALGQISRMRGLLSDTVADAAIEASYVIFEGPSIDRQSERTSLGVERWLADAEKSPTAPPTEVLLELAATPDRVFARVGDWINAPNLAHREVALAARVQRVYSPRIPASHITEQVNGIRVHCVEYPSIGLVLAATTGDKELEEVALQLCDAAERFEPREGESGPGVYAIELLLSNGTESSEDEHADQLVERLAAALRDGPPRSRITLTVLAESGQHACRTLTPDPDGLEFRADLHGLHPETAERIDLQRLTAFELERLPSVENIYAFRGTSREVPGDERVFVLADVRGRSPLAGVDASIHLPSFERAFYQATRSLRVILQMRDPRRRLQWNRIALFVAPAILLTPEIAADISRRLAPLVRHLGLEKVLVRLNLLSADAPDDPAKAMEIVITDSPGSQMELSWRDPHHDPLHPAQDYERKVVEARRRRRVYPYEIVRMLTSGDEGLEDAASGTATLATGRFQEYDLDPSSDGIRAIPIDRAPGFNTSAVVFGIISTATVKVPEGMSRVLILSDPTMGMGALSHPECDRLVAAIDLAEERGLPVEWVPVSSGAKIAMDSGTENLDATARVVRRIVTFTEKGCSINVIVQGVNVGAQSYFDALATMLMHTRGILIMTPGASMVLTGRAALEASGAVSAEDEEAIGGYERIMGPNGQAQYYARSLLEAYRILYDHYEYTYVVPGESGPRRFETTDSDGRSVCDFPIPEEDALDFKTVGEIFDDETNPGRKRPFAMRAVMGALRDQDALHLERWRSMVGAETSIIWDTHLGGIPVTMVGVESHNIQREGYRPLDGPESWSGGTLFPLSSKKIARAINAASGVRPVVILANLSGFDGSPESLRKLQLEYGAEIARAVVKFDGPLLFLVVSRYHGGAYVVFSQELNDSLTSLALEGSYASVIGGGPAAAVVFAREVRARAVADPRVVAGEQALRRFPSADGRAALDSLIADVTLEKQAELAEEFDQIHSVQRAQEVGSLDRIIHPRDMRRVLIAALEQALGELPADPDRA